MPSTAAATNEGAPPAGESSLPPIPAHVARGISAVIAAEAVVSEWGLRVANAAGSGTSAEALGSEASALASTHLRALQMRLASPAPDEPIVVTATGPCPGSEALQGLFCALSAAAIRYSAVQTAAHRLRDSWISAPSGTTAHLARQFTQEYLALLARVPAALADAAAEELWEDGLSCACSCPACSLGLCLCAETSKTIWREAWVSAAPTMIAGARIPRPRTDSAAEKGGIEVGDHILAVDRVPVESVASLQASLKAHTSDSPIVLSVRRGEKSRMVRLAAKSSSQLAAEADASECSQPSGSNFYLDRARDRLQQIRRHEAPVVRAVNGIASLTARELQVLRLLADGATNPVISEKLRIQRPTVARHVSSILGKLGAVNRSQAAAFAAERGLLTDF